MGEQFGGRAGAGQRAGHDLTGFTTHIRSTSARHARLDVVFCTSDDMALGVVDALRETTSPSTRDTVVIGVDGIPETMKMIAAGVGPMRATVVQDSHRLAEGHRGRGYARAVLHEALRRSRAAECDLIFLFAEENDWPSRWYERLGVTYRDGW